MFFFVFCFESLMLHEYKYIFWHKTNLKLWWNLEIMCAYVVHEYLIIMKIYIINV